MKSAKMLQITGLMLTALLSSMPAQAKLKVVEKHKHYKVRGKNMAEIEKSIHEHGMPSENGVTFAANTDYSLSWQFTVQESNSGCKIATADTNVTITYTLPKLDSSLNEILQNQWDSYYSALKTHEDGHAELGVAAAKEIEAELVKLPPMQNCLELAKAANSLGESIADKYHNDNLKYDLETGHGHSQGAFFLANN